MSNERDNFKAGVFVIVGVLLALVIVFILADFRKLIEQRQQVQVFYRLSDGIKGLKVGAEVALGNQAVGAISAIEEVVDADRITGMRVTMDIPKRYQLRANAVVELVVPPLGSGTKLNIRSVGEGKPYSAGTDLPGHVAGSDLTANLVKDIGILDEQRQQIREIIANIRELTQSLKTDVPKITRSVDELIEAAKPLPTEMRDTVARFNEATADVKAMTASLKSKTETWFSRIDTISEKAGSAITTMDDLIQSKKQAMGEAVDNVQQLTRKLNTETYQEIQTAIGKADAALASVKKAAEQLDVMATGQRPVLERAIANAQITTGQLKLAAIEIRRSPWRLFYKPGDAELETDNLYDAARSFALAAGSLDAAAQSLSTVTQARGGSDPQVQGMIDQLEKLFGRFEQAEAGFWKALGDTSATKPQEKP